MEKTLTSFLKYNFRFLLAFFILQRSARLSLVRQSLELKDFCRGKRKTTLFFATFFEDIFCCCFAAGIGAKAGAVSPMRDKIKKNNVKKMFILRYLNRIQHGKLSVRPNLT
jgi:hypothetical protein